VRIWSRCGCSYCEAQRERPRQLRSDLTSYACNSSAVTDATESPDVAPQKPTKSKNSDSSLQLQIGPDFQFEFVPRDTEESGFCDEASLAISSANSCIHVT